MLSSFPTPPHKKAGNQVQPFVTDDEQDTPRQQFLKATPIAALPEDSNSTPWRNDSSIENANSSRLSSEDSKLEESLHSSEIFVPVDPAVQAKETIADLQTILEQSNMLVTQRDVKLQKTLCSTLKSRIYVANWRSTKVVVKTVKDPKTSTISEEDRDSSLRELLHEIRLLNNIRHPDLVQFLGASFDCGQCWFLSEHMDGGDVEAYLSRKSSKMDRVYHPPRYILLSWSAAVARALSFLHGRSQPILHRDLKPMNLLLNRALVLKVTDFGIAKELPCPFELGDRERYQMTGGVGTWRYMAPEVVRYEQYTNRIDVYSFGLIMYRMATGLQPFQKFCGNDSELILKAYLRGEEPRPEIPAALCTPGALPQGFEALMQDTWHVVPQQRPSASECVERLSEIKAKEKNLETSHASRPGIRAPIEWVRNISGMSASSALSPRLN